jgi:flagellar biosynthesis protein FliP
MVIERASVDAPSFIANLGFSVITVLVVLFFVLVFSAYVKIVTVLSIVRVGLGLGSLPAVFVVGGLSFGLSFFVMYPTLLDSSRAMDQVLQARSAPVSDQLRAAAFNAGLERWKVFLRTCAHKSEVERFTEIAAKLDAAGKVKDNEQKPEASASSVDPNSWRILAPAFLVSELKEAFATGLTLFLPLLVIDLFIANVLVAVGLERMSPAVVSFPFKLLLFVMVDGWTLITTNLVSTYI